MVAAGFTLRKIRTVHTLGEKLRRARRRLGVDLIEAELQTKVRAKYLEALENEDFESLPNEIYVKGFITAYASYLGLPTEKIYSLYRQQKAIRRNSDGENFSNKQVKEQKAFIVTPKFIAVALGVLFCLSAVYYIVFQVASFASVPKLTIESPEKDSVVSSESIVVVGSTEVSAVLTINKEEVPTNNGNFKKEITLQSGLNTILITAKNKTNKESSKVIIVERVSKTAEK